MSIIYHPPTRLADFATGRLISFRFDESPVTVRGSVWELPSHAGYWLLVFQEFIPYRGWHSRVADTHLPPSLRGSWCYGICKEPNLESQVSLLWRCNIEDFLVGSDCYGEPVYVTR